MGAECLYMWEKHEYEEVIRTRLEVIIESRDVYAEVAPNVLHAKPSPYTFLWAS